MADKLGALTQLMQRIVHSIPEQYGAKQVLRAKQLGDRHMTLRNQLLDGKDLSHYATIEEFLKNADPRASSHSMIASAMKDAARAPKYWNEDYRLLELPGQTDDALNGALGFYTPGHWQGTPAENAVYIQNLGGLEQGAGSALLRELARRYPDNPMVLESLPIHGTKQFYNNRGFVPQGRNVIIPGSEHENFWLSRGADLKKRGGLVAPGETAMKFDWKKLHVDDAGVEFGRRVDALHKLLQAEYAERVQAPIRAARRNDDARDMAYSQSASDDLTVPRALPQITERKAPNIPATVLRQLLPGGQTNGMLEAVGEIVGPAIDLWSSKKPLTEKLGRTVAELAQWAPSKVVQMAVLGGMPMEAQAGLFSKPSLVEYLLSRPSAIFTNRLPSIRDTGLIYNTHHPRAVSEMSQPDIRRQFEREVLSIHPNKVWTERPVSSAVVDQSAWGDTGFPVYPFAGYGKQALVTQPLGKMPQARVSIGDSLNNWEEGFGDVLRPAKVSDLTEKYLRDGLAAKDLTPTLSRLQELVHGAGPGEYMEVLYPTPTAAMNATRAFVDPTGQVQKLRDLINLRMNKSDRNDELIRALGLKAGGRVKFDRGGIVKKFLSRMPEYVEGIAPRAAPVGALSVVKDKGGNWVTGSVENALKGLKRSHFGHESLKNWEPYGHNPLMGVHTPSGEIFEPLDMTRLRRTSAVNSWVEGPLTKYVKTRMATPDDEVRKLAEQGVLHVDPTSLRYGQRQVHPSGEYLQKLAQNPDALKWENAADFAIYPEQARTFKNSVSGSTGRPTIERNPWLANLSDDAPVYDLTQNMATQDLGFPHLIDELSNALNPESGLPRHLLLTPEAVQNMSMEKAVRRVADINAWREAQKAAANAELANKAAVVREYAENNPKGLRWVELKAQDPKTQGWQQQPDGWARPDPNNPGFWNMNKDPARKALEDQLKYEGDTMGHCVGGYCDDVLSGRSRIFSLRDAKGEPHVTIEARPPTVSKNFDPDGDTLSELINGLPGDEFAKFKRDILDKVPRAMDLDDAAALQAELTLAHQTFGPMYKARLEGPPSIVQIKGKGNRKPNDEYLPFVQDFVRNSPLGKSWADVGDLQNTGLRKIGSRYMLPEEHNAILDRRLPDGRPVLDQDMVDAQEAMQRIIEDADPNRFASGGLVTKSSLDRLYAVLQ